MAVSQNLGIEFDEGGAAVVGGGVGIGAPLALRETVDVQDGEPMALLGEPGSMLARVSRPSVAWGLGVGSLTGLAMMTDRGSLAMRDFLTVHTFTAIPTGIASALLPKGGASTATAAESLSQVREAEGAASDGTGDTPTDHEAADGAIPPAQ